MSFDAQFQVPSVSLLCAATVFAACALAWFQYVLLFPGIFIL